MKRFALWLLLFIFVLCCIACDAMEKTPDPVFAETAEPTAIIEILTPIEMEEPATAETPLPLEPTPTPYQEQDFATLDLLFFEHAVSESWIARTAFLKSAADYGLEELVPSWGSFSQAAREERLGFYSELLERLGYVNREDLSEHEQSGYDALEQYLQTEVALLSIPYYEEPLSPSAGAHTQVSLLLHALKLRTEADVLNYFALLRDLPRYFEEILLYEQEKAAGGLFMSEEALEQVLSECRDYALSLSLPDAVAQAIQDLPNIGSAEKRELVSEGKALYTDCVRPAYEALAAGLEELEDSCMVKRSYYAMGTEGRAYFAAMLKRQGGCDLSPADALSLLEDQLNNAVVSAALIRMENPKLREVPKKSLSLGSIQEDLAFLKQSAESLIAPLPAHALEIQEMDGDLRELVDAAAYVTPPIDDWDENTVLYNSHQYRKDVLIVLAHETYPGHLYQSVLHRSNPDISLSQKVMNLDSYAEGWALSSVQAFIENQNLYSRDELLLYYYEMMSYDILLPAIISVRVNGLGEGLDDVKHYLAAYGLDEAAELFYELAITHPFYYLTYALGYTGMQTLLDGARKDLGDGFDISLYLRELLAHGPLQFEPLRERIDIFTDLQVSD